MRLKALARELLPSVVRLPLMRLRSRLFDTYAVKSYSQEGEDLILERLFDARGQGFYIDVGAHHPRRFSNTHAFYRRGWTGLNIEPNPDAMQAFRRERKRDTNLQMGVGERAGALPYFIFDDPALNTFDQDLMRWREANTPYRVVRTVEIPVERLDEILRRHLPPGQRIDFLTVDVEGLDLQVLRSNDWDAFRPECVLAEALGTSLQSALQGEVSQFMSAQGYEPFSKLYNTLVFRDARRGREDGRS